MLKGLRKRLALIFTAFTGAVLAAVLGVSYYFVAQQTIYDNDVWFSTTADRVASTVMTNEFTGEKASIDPGQYFVYVQMDGEALPGLIARKADAVSAQKLPDIGSPEEAEMFETAKSVAEEEGLSEWMAESYYLMGSAYGLALPEEVQIQLNEDSATARVAQETEPAPVTGDYRDYAQSVAIAISPVASSEGVFNMEYGGVRYRATYFNWYGYGSGGMESRVPVFYEAVVMEDLSGQTGSLLWSALWYLLLLAAGLALLFIANWFLAKLILRPTEEGLRRQTEFVAAASHELRSPLAVIRSSLSAAEAAEKPGEAAKYQTAAADEAQRMSRLVDDLLLLAGGDAGSWQLSHEAVDLDTLLIDAGEVYRPLAKEKGVELYLELPNEALPQVKGDAERLRQILTVLMDNALQYAPEDTAITLAAKEKKDRVLISVADRGRGVPDEEKERVFQRFYRADKSRTDKAHFGLGLSVARELAELHGGRITVKDTKDGGATFELTLPRM